MNQYYNNLRQEVPVTSDMAHVYRHQIRGITPQEVEGLSMVLKLTRMIAEQVGFLLYSKTCIVSKI